MYPRVSSWGREQGKQEKEEGGGGEAGREMMKQWRR